MNILGIDLGTTQTCAALIDKNDDGVKLVGYGQTRTEGVKKGAITNIEYVAESIRRAVTNVKIMSGIEIYDRVVVSISGVYAKSVQSKGTVSIDGEVGIKEIMRAVHQAKHYATLPEGHQMIHILPYNIKVDDTEHIDDPLGMSAKSLVVDTHIIFAQETHIKNLRKAVDLAGLRTDNIVLSGYASSIACLSETEKELGAILVDIGGSVCDIVARLGNSIIYNDFFPYGSFNITQDLSTILKTPIPDAEKIKLAYKNLVRSSDRVVQTPKIGDENRMNEYNIDVITDIIYSRIQETLAYIVFKIKEGVMAKDLKVVKERVILTGGMTKITGFDEIAAVAFGQLSTEPNDYKPSVRIAAVDKSRISGYEEILNDSEYSCAVGLCLYEAGFFTPYEMDLNGKLRFKGEEVELKPIREPVPEPLDFESDEEELIIEREKVKNEPKKSIFSKIWQGIAKNF